MPNDNSGANEPEHRDGTAPLTSSDGVDVSPTLRQQLHAATGDRKAEAKALADRLPEGVDADDAKEAVRRAHGEADGERPFGDTGSDIASPRELRAVADERNNEGETSDRAH